MQIGSKWFDSSAEASNRSKSIRSRHCSQPACKFHYMSDMLNIVLSKVPPQVQCRTSVDGDRLPAMHYCSSIVPYRISVCSYRSIHMFTHWRFARGIVNNKAYPVHLIHDGSRDSSQEIELERVWLRCHEICRDNCPQLRYCQHSVGIG